MVVNSEELAGSPQIQWTRGNGGTARQMFKLAWEDVDAFFSQYFPAPYISGNQIVIPPGAYFPNSNLLVAHSISIEPFDPESPDGLDDIPNNYTLGGAKATVDFITPAYDQNNPTYDGPAGTSTRSFVAYKGSISGEFLTYPNNSLRWDLPSDQSLSDSPLNPLSMRWLSVQNDTQASVIIPTLEHTLTWPQVAFPNWVAIRQCVGKINAFAFCGAPPETLLFVGATWSRDTCNQQIRCWNMEYKFVEKNQNPFDPNNPQGWNYFLRSDGLSAGTFMRMRKRVPGGFTTTATATNVGANQLPVVSSQSFPQNPSTLIKIVVNGNDYYDVTNNTSTNTFNLQFGETTVNNYAAGVTVAQCYQATLSAAIDDKQANISVVNANYLPASQATQYYLLIGNYDTNNNPLQFEIVSVVAGQGTVNLGVLRGVLGTAGLAWPNGQTVTVFPGNVYNIADFNSLFTSGLVTG